MQRRDFCRLNDFIAKFYHVSNLFNEYREAYSSARTTEHTQQQRPRSDAEVGNVRLFIVSSDANKEVTEQRVAEIMSEETGDGEWRDSKI